MAWLVKLRGGVARVRDGVGAGAPMRILSCDEATRFEHKPLEDGNLIIEECEDAPVIAEVPQPDPPKPKRRRRSKKAE